MEQQEQCEHAQTLPSRERLRVGEQSSGIRGRQSQQAISPGHRPGYTAGAANALQGQKNLLCINAFALSGRSFFKHFYPGRCPGLTAFAPLGRLFNNYQNFNDIIAQVHLYFGFATQGEFCSISTQGEFYSFATRRILQQEQIFIDKLLETPLFKGVSKG
jgi:hypothetical protein